MTDIDVTLSVIVPTTGRGTLSATLASAAEQLEPGDEILVLCNRDGDFGNRARQDLLERARGTHLLFMDDDDQFARGAFAAMRCFAKEHPGRVGIFRIQYLNGRRLWASPELRRTNVSTQMFCVPNAADKLGSWTLEASESAPKRRDYVADFDFISRTVELQGEPIFVDVVVALVRSDRRPLVRRAQQVAAAGKAVGRRITRLVRRSP